MGSALAGAAAGAAVLPQQLLPHESQQESQQSLWKRARRRSSRPGFSQQSLHVLQQSLHVLQQSFWWKRARRRSSRPAEQPVSQQLLQLLVQQEPHEETTGAEPPQQSPAPASHAVVTSRKAAFTVFSLEVSSSKTALLASGSSTS